MISSGLAMFQQSKGCKVTLVCLYEDGCIGKELAAKGVQVISLNLPRGKGTLKLLKPLVRICRQTKPDVIHVHTLGVELPVAIVAFLNNIKIRILTVHGIAQYHGWRKVRARLRIILANICYNKVVCVSEAVRQNEIRRGIKKDKTIVIWNGIDTDRFHPNRLSGTERAKALSINVLEPFKFVVGMGAQLETFKDIPTLLRAAAKIKELGHNDILFVIAGTGSLETQLKELTCQMKIDSFCKFIGPVKNMPAFLNSIDALVLTSPLEGLSIISLEAMATAVPVITTDSKGVRDCVVNGETGILTPVGDTDGIANAILKLKNDRTMLEKMGKAGLTRLQKYFTIEKQQQAYWSLISKKETFEQ